MLSKVASCYMTGATPSECAQPRRLQLFHNVCLPFLDSLPGPSPVKSKAAATPTAQPDDSLIPGNSSLCQGGKSNAAQFQIAFIVLIILVMNNSEA